MLNRGCDSVIGSNEQSYTVQNVLTKYCCLLLEFYFPARNMRGKRVKTNYVFYVVYTSAKMRFI